MNIDILKEDLINWIVECGTYAEVVKSNVTNQPDKIQQKHVLGQGLTNSDLAIERYFELCLLSKYPEIGFEGEETTDSLNQEFFLDNTELKVVLDPINHTSFYQLGSDAYDVIVSLVCGTQIIFAACYQPARKLLFFADQSGAWISRGAVHSFSKQTSVLLNFDGEKKKIVITSNESELLGKVIADYEIVDLVDLYGKKKDLMAISDLLNNEASGLLKKDGHVRDWGAIAYIAFRAGAIVNGSKDNFPKFDDNFRFPYLCVSIDQETEWLQRLDYC